MPLGGPGRTSTRGFLSRLVSPFLSPPVQVQQPAGQVFTVTLSVVSVSIPTLNNQVGKNLLITTLTVPAVVKQAQKKFFVVTLTVPSLLKQVGKVLSVISLSVPSLAAAAIRAKILS